MLRTPRTTAVSIDPRAGARHEVRPCSTEAVAGADDHPQSQTRQHTQGDHRTGTRHTRHPAAAGKRLRSRGRRAREALGMSATERATADAASISPEIMLELHCGDDPGAERGFIRVVFVE
jgi:hypothetical protein